ncbi:hypothetical protein GJ496_002856 [Pomphorhynchus laevis]|nr:hypothetical protein GJ496_002856 [Pomphorhynchus laevis]
MHSSLKSIWKYLANPRNIRIQSELYDMALSLGKSGYCMLDIGCGVPSRPSCKHRSLFNYIIRLDISFTMLNIASMLSKLESVAYVEDYVLCDLNHLPFKAFNSKIIFIFR